MFQATCLTCKTPFTSRNRGRSYCCHKCYTNSDAFRKRMEERRKPPVELTCVGCGVTFSRPANQSIGEATYCSLECYYKADKSDERLKGSIKRGSRISLKCEHCDTEFSIMKSEAEFIKNGVPRKRRFCNQVCWRLWFVVRFDAFVASAVGVEQMQSYDEFLTQESLPCLIEGCNWEGRHLGMHVSHAHGISASKFKEMAGFNRNTGLTIQEVKDAHSERNKIGEDYLQDYCFKPGHSPGPQGPRRRESREHQSKAIKAAWSEGRYNKRKTE